MFDRFDRRTILAVLIVSALVLCIFVLIFRPLGTESDVLKMLIGALITLATNVVGFDFGSSAGSEKKQATIDSLINSPVEQPRAAPVPTAPEPAPAHGNGAPVS